MIREIHRYVVVSSAPPSPPGQAPETMCGSEQLNAQLEFVQIENEILKTELGSAQEQIASLKTSLASVSLFN